MRKGLDLLALGAAAHHEAAVVSADGGGFDYGRLRSVVAAGRTALARPDKALVFIDRPRSPTGLVGYLAALSAGHAVVLAEEGGAALWDEFVAAYEPELVVAAPDAPLSGSLRESGFRPATADPFPVWRRPGAWPAAEIHPDLGLLMRTSGSLGPAKTVRLSYGNLSTNAVAIAEALRLRGADRAMTSLPLDFSFGLSMVNSAFAAGASVGLAAYSPSSQSFWEYLDHVSGTCVGAVPSTYAFLRDRAWDPAAHTSLRLLLHAGGPLDEGALTFYRWRMAAGGGEFVSMYGQSEATARISYLPAALASQHAGSAGVAIPGGRITIERPDGSPARDGETGEIVYAGPGVMMGYATCRADLSAGDVQGNVLRTGDLGHLRGGLLYVTGRMDRQVKLFGRRIDLDEIERRLGAQRWTVAVEATGDDGLVVVAEPAPGLREACQALGRRLGLPPSSVRLVLMDNLPYNHRGKLDRNLVKEAL